VALAVKLRLLESLIPKDPETAVRMTREVGSDAGDALGNLRDLARGIYPPLLADQGLAAALEAQARKVPVPVTVDADGVGRYAQEVEAAVYFSCLEALQNITKYAEASSVTIRLSSHEGLAFEIRDDGHGSTRPSPARDRPGIVDRVAAIGERSTCGRHPARGTTITGRIRSTRSNGVRASRNPGSRLGMLWRRHRDRQRRDHSMTADTGTRRRPEDRGHPERLARPRP
jgi:signal transduction histidine kinase